MARSRRSALFFLGITVTAVLLQMVAIAECGHGHRHKKGHGHHMEELLLLTGILAKVLQHKGGGHHKSHAIPIPIYIPIHHGHHDHHHGHHGHHHHHG